MDKLAIFAGLTIGPNEDWYYQNTSPLRMLMFCRRQDWHPDKNPTHGDLVLKAMAEEYDLEIESFGGWTVTAWQKCSRSNTSDARAEADVLWEAVCRAALEVITKGENDGN